MDVCWDVSLIAVDIWRMKVTHEDAVFVGNLSIGLLAFFHKVAGDRCSLLAFLYLLQEGRLWKSAL